MGHKNLPKKKAGKRSYIFSLTGSTSVFHKSEVTVDFSPIPRKKQQSIHILPRFNLDGKHFTPAFSLLLCETDPQEYLKDHQDKVQDYAHEKSKIFMPKPRSKHRYCSVCKTHYEDYQNHLNSYDHQDALANSSFQKEIIELSNSFRAQMKIQFPEASQELNIEVKKIISSETSVTMSQSNFDPTEGDISFKKQDYFKTVKS